MACLGINYMLPLYPESAHLATKVLIIIGSSIAGGLAIMVGAIRLRANRFQGRVRLWENAEVAVVHMQRIWDSAYQNWLKLSFCHKHSVVFRPDTGSWRHPSAMTELLGG